MTSLSVMGILKKYFAHLYKDVFARPHVRHRKQELHDTTGNEHCRIPIYQQWLCLTFYNRFCHSVTTVCDGLMTREMYSAGKHGENPLPCTPILGERAMLLHMQHALGYSLLLPAPSFALAFVSFRCLSLNLPDFFTRASVTTPLSPNSVPPSPPLSVRLTSDSFHFSYLSLCFSPFCSSSR